VGGVRIQTGVQVGEFFVTAFQKVLDEAPHSIEVVNGNRVQTDVFELAVKENNGDMMLLNEIQSVFCGVGDDGAPNNAVDIEFDEGQNFVKFLDGVIVTAANDCAESVSRKDMVDIFNDFGEKGIGKVRDDKTDGHGVVLGFLKITHSTSGDIAHFAGREQDFVANLVLDTIFAVKGTRNGHHGDTGLSGNIF